MTHRLPRLFSIALAGCTAALLTGLATPADAVEFGKPKVLSQSGQRLKVAIPYVDDTSDKLSVTRFSVRAVSMEGGSSRLKPNDLTIAQPVSADVLYLQSLDIIDGTQVTLEVAVHDERSAAGQFVLSIPASQAALSTGDDVLTTRTTSTSRRSSATRRQALVRAAAPIALTEHRPATAHPSDLLVAPRL